MAKELRSVLFLDSVLGHFFVCTVHRGCRDDLRPSRDSRKREGWNFLGLGVLGLAP